MSAAAMDFIIISTMMPLSTELQKIVLFLKGVLLNWIRFVTDIFQTEIQSVNQLLSGNEIDLLYFCAAHGIASSAVNIFFIPTFF